MKIVVASGKGGVGKSMLASALVMLFSKEYKVVAVDCDVDAPNLHLWLGEDENWDEVEKISTNEKPVIDSQRCNGCGRCVDICAFNALSRTNVLAQFTARPSINSGQAQRRELKFANTKFAITFNPFFCEGCGACEVICPQKAIKMKQIKNAEIRIKKNVHNFPLVSAQLYPGMTGSGKIVEEIKKRTEKFDWEAMILDSPAGTGCPVIAAVKDADFAVLVTEPTPSGFSDLRRVLTVVNHFKIPYGTIVNKWDINPDGSSKIENWSKNNFLGKIAYDKRIFQAIANLKPVMETDLPIKKEIKTIRGVIAQFTCPVPFSSIGVARPSVDSG